MKDRLIYPPQCRAETSRRCFAMRKQELIRLDHNQRSAAAHARRLDGDISAWQAHQHWVNTVFDPVNLATGIDGHKYYDMAQRGQWLNGNPPWTWAGTNGLISNGSLLLPPEASSVISKMSFVLYASSHFEVDSEEWHIVMDKKHEVDTEAVNDTHWDSNILGVGLYNGIN